MWIKTTDRRVLVRDDPAPEVFGRIVVPGGVQDHEAQTGVVIGCNPECNVCLGDRVLFDPWIGTREVLEGEDVRLLEHEEVLAVVQEDD